MYVAKSIDVDHQDLIHDVAYDFYGRRMATCSSDQKVKIWDQDSSGNWSCSASWKSHSGSVWKVNWAHPEFGQVIATCSFDRTAAVWEELIGERHGGLNLWVKKTTLVDSRTSVTDVKFGPKQMGLVLATCSADGTVRIYEAPEVMNLSQWSLVHEIHVKLPCSCITWNPSLSRLHNPMIAVGCDQDSGSSSSPGGKVKVYEYGEMARRWSLVETFSTITAAVHDIAFAPNIGRSYHVLAIAGKDLRMITLRPLAEGSGKEGSQTTTRFDIRQAGQFDEHGSAVWRVCWNITGTILASSGDDGCVKLWKANYLDNWACVTTLRGDGQAVEGASSLAKHGFSKLPVNTVQANWH